MTEPEIIDATEVEIQKSGINVTHDFVLRTYTEVVNISKQLSELQAGNKQILTSMGAMENVHMDMKSLITATQASNQHLAEISGTLKGQVADKDKIISGKDTGVPLKVFAWVIIALCIAFLTQPLRDLIATLGQSKSVIEGEGYGIRGTFKPQVSP